MLRWDEHRKPGQGDEDGRWDVSLDDVEAHLALEHDSHDHAGIGQVVVVRGVIVSKLYLQVKLRQADVLVDVVA